MNGSRFNSSTIGPEQVRPCAVGKAVTEIGKSRWPNLQPLAAAMVFMAACSFPYPGDVPDDDGPAVVDAAVDGTTPDGDLRDAPRASGPPSCEDLPPTCGATGNHDCCESIAIPGGSFYRSYDAATDNYNDMSFAAMVSDFRLDTYEVSVARFRAFVEAGFGTQANPPAAGAGARYLNGADHEGGWENGYNAYLAADTSALKAALICSSDTTRPTWTDEPGDNETKPINCVTWYEAFAFCAWDGGFLPTEAEWNYAAAGGSAHRSYPWSVPPTATIIDCSFANYYVGTPSGTFCTPNGLVGAATAVGSTSPKGDGRWGGADLAGNVSEWVLDWYVSPYASTTCNDCAYLQPSTGRVYRGGGFDDGQGYVRVARRQAGSTGTRDRQIGFRCARTAATP